MEITKIKIPAKYRVIAIRVNNENNKSPLGYLGPLGQHEWPEHGAVRPFPGSTRGLFGTLLTQDQRMLTALTSSKHSKFLILEVDTRKIRGWKNNKTGLRGLFTKRNKTEIEFSKEIEVQFSECNVLFNGQLFDFLERLKEYASAEQFKKISDKLTAIHNMYLPTVNEVYFETKMKEAVPFCKPNKIKIPIEHRVIILRANINNKGPLLDTFEWPNGGSVYSKGERGLFGLALFQDMYFIEQISYVHPEPDYMILEVDSRNIKVRKETLDHHNDCEFSECNVLFTGGIEAFLIQLMRYAAPEQYSRINEILTWKVQELRQCKTSIEKMKGYIIRSQMRNEMFKSVSLSSMLVKIAIKQIKEDQRSSRMPV